MHVLLIGGGLANGLLAWRLQAARPEVRLTLLEGSDRLGGNHTWSFHASDLSPAQLTALEPLVSHRWEGHDVAFGSHQRTLAGAYLSIRSADFDRVLRQRLGDQVRLGARVRQVTPTSVELESGETLEGDLTVDGRGFGAGLGGCGWQKFLGQELTLSAPHGLVRPMIMDCRVDQLGAFRFVYLLPFSERTVLVEDTYYADDAQLQPEVLRARIAQYVAGRGWTVQSVDREELAALPIPLNGQAPVFHRPTAGVAAGFFHATTGYSLPVAVDVADAIAALPSLEPAAVTRMLQLRARKHWRGQAFFRLLNRMLFKGAEGDERVKIFESFYRHDEALVGRFYAGRLTALDKLKVLARGAPTVPGNRAVRAAFS